MPAVTPNPLAIARSKTKVAVEEVNVASAVARLKNAMGGLEHVFVHRTEEIAALTLAFASAQHILFEGAPGVAKSDLVREALKRIVGQNLVIYDKMFGKGTKDDDVFGPVDMNKYRQDAEWVHNTKGSLAACHFANLEELGRASDMLLPSMMTVLNERLFHNGSKVQQCPLITAAASTNFLTENDELAAFNDRWLIRMVVKPLDSNQKCIDMMNRSMKPRPAVTDTVTLNEILAINQAVAKIECEAEVVPLYVELVKDYMKAQTKATLEITDRRLVYAFRLAKAQAVLDERSIVTPEDLSSVRYAVSIHGKDDESVFSTVLQRVVGNVEAMREESHHIKLMEKFLSKLTKAYDPSLKTAALEELLRETDKLIGGMKARTKPITQPDNQTKFNNILQAASELRSSIQEQL